MLIMDRHIIKLIMYNSTSTIIEIPEGAIFLCAIEEFDSICLVFEGDPNGMKEQKTFYAYEAYGIIHGSEQYIGSVKLNGINHFIYSD